MRVLLGVCLGIFVAGPAQEAAGQTPPSLPPEVDPEDQIPEPPVPDPDPGPPASQEDRITELEDRVAELDQRVQQAESEKKRSPITLGGYVDFGFFVPVGDGPGWIQDFDNRNVPAFEGRYGWVFLGDILSTAVNSRGEVADLGDAPGAARFDGIHSGGAAGFILNEVNLRVNAGLHDSLKVSTSINFVPRTGSRFSLGDFFDLDLAEVEWQAWDAPQVSVFAGKIEPVLGIEYQDRKASDRSGITPSLIQRYTSGTQLGVKVRAKLFSDWIILAAAITNGSSTTEQFHFYNEIDANHGKTFSGRLSLRVPLSELAGGDGDHTLEVGGSGEYGPQDRSNPPDGDIWFVGVDLQYRTTDFALKAQWLKGAAPGSTLAGAWELDLRHGAYLEASYLFLPWLGASVRAGLRDAFVALGTARAYLTKSWRVTVGLRAIITHHVVLKAEYLKNGEYGDVPEFQNDIFTTSLVLRY